MSSKYQIVCSVTPSLNSWLVCSFRKKKKKRATKQNNKTKRKKEKNNTSVNLIVSSLVSCQYVKFLKKEGLSLIRCCSITFESGWWQVCMLINCCIILTCLGGLFTFIQMYLIHHLAYSTTRKILFYPRFGELRFVEFYTTGKPMVQSCEAREFIYESEWILILVCVTIRPVVLRI